MAARTFEDSAGATWEVFEVHRASGKLGGVSAGLELGWLAFVKEGEKRRLAPFPSDWEQVGDSELEQLCARARLSAPRPIAPQAGPRIRPTPPDGGPLAERAEHPTPTVPAEPVAEAPGDLEAIREVVRAFAHEARTTGLPAVDAMVRLKAVLAERFPGADHAARDSRLVRRAFVDAYYFERDA